MALGGGFTIGANKLNGALVHLDTRKDSTLLQYFNKRLPTFGLLVKGLLKEDDTAEILESTRGEKEELAEAPAVLLNILNIDAGQALANCASGLIGGKDPLPWGADVSSILDELIWKKMEVRNLSLIPKKYHTNG